MKLLRNQRPRPHQLRNSHSLDSSIWPNAKEDAPGLDYSPFHAKSGCPPQTLPQRRETRATHAGPHRRFFAALAADASIGCAGDDLFDPGKVRRQLLPTGMFARFPEWQFQLLAVAFGFDFGAAHPRLQLEQFQLVIGEFLAAGSVLLDPNQTQSFFQYTDLILCEFEPIPVNRQRAGRGRLAVRGRGSFVIQTSAEKVEANWIHCKRLMRNDGYTYEIKQAAIPPPPKESGSFA